MVILKDHLSMFVKNCFAMWAFPFFYKIVSTNPEYILLCGFLKSFWTISIFVGMGNGDWKGQNSIRHMLYLDPEKNQYKAYVFANLPSPRWWDRVRLGTWGTLPRFLSCMSRAFHFASVSPDGWSQVFLDLFFLLRTRKSQCWRQCWALFYHKVWSVTE